MFQNKEIKFFKNTNLDDFNNIWFEYFDLGTDYGKIKDILRNMDEHLESDRIWRGYKNS